MSAGIDTCTCSHYFIQISLVFTGSKTFALKVIYSITVTGCFACGEFHLHVLIPSTLVISLCNAPQFLDTEFIHNIWYINYMDLHCPRICS